MARRSKRGLYGALGVSPDASPEQIKRAFRRKAKECHPDRNPGPEAEAQFKQINEAYEVLSDPARRADYDRTGATGPPHSAESTQSGSAESEEEFWMRVELMIELEESYSALFPEYWPEKFWKWLKRKLGFEVPEPPTEFDWFCRILGGSLTGDPSISATKMVELWSRFLVNRPHRQILRRQHAQRTRHEDAKRRERSRREDSERRERFRKEQDELRARRAQEMEELRARREQERKELQKRREQERKELAARRDQERKELAARREQERKERQRRRVVR